MVIGCLTLTFTRSLGTCNQGWRLVSKNPFKWIFAFVPYLQSTYNNFIHSKRPPKAAIFPRWSPWHRIVLVHSPRSTRLDAVWLVESVSQFDLIRWIGGCSRDFKCSQLQKLNSSPSNSQANLGQWSAPISEHSTKIDQRSRVLLAFLKQAINSMVTRGICDYGKNDSQCISLYICITNFNAYMSS